MRILLISLVSMGAGFRSGVALVLVKCGITGRSPVCLVFLLCIPRMSLLGSGTGEKKGPGFLMASLGQRLGAIE